MSSGMPEFDDHKLLSNTVKHNGGSFIVVRSEGVWTRRGSGVEEIRYAAKSMNLMPSKEAAFINFPKVIQQLTAISEIAQIAVLLEPASVRGLVDESRVVFGSPLPDPRLKETANSQLLLSIMQELATVLIYRAEVVSGWVENSAEKWDEAAKQVTLARRRNR